MEPTIRGERTTLRPILPDDEDLLLGWLTDPGVYDHWGGTLLDRERVKAEFTENRDPGWAGFIVEVAGRPVGFLQYWHTDDNPEADTGGIDMVLLPAERGQGFGPDAARAIVGYLIGRCGWRRVTVDPSLDNAAGIRAWARAGFVPDHEAPNHPDGPSLIMAIDAGNWHASRET